IQWQVPDYIITAFKEFLKLYICTSIPRKSLSFPARYSMGEESNLKYINVFTSSDYDDFIPVHDREHNENLFKKQQQQQRLQNKALKRISQRRVGQSKKGFKSSTKS
ncbi:unnamed protein product, partial [Ceratitis capitata]